MDLMRTVGGMVALSGALAAACGPVSSARTEVSGRECTPDVRLVEGQLDAGVAHSFTVKNVGDRGPVRFRSTLSTSEGEWTRSQTLVLEADEERRLTFFFQEPSMNADNVQCQLVVAP